MSKQHEKSKGNGYLGIFVLIGILLILSIILILVFTNIYYSNIRNTTTIVDGSPVILGSLGDFLSGMIGSIIGSISFITVVCTMLIQRRENRDAEKRFYEQYQSQQKQNAEGTFFYLLQSFDTLIKSFDTMDSKGVVHSGRGRIYDEIRTYFRDDIYNTLTNGSMFDPDKTTELRGVFNQSLLRTEFQGFFYLVSTIIKYVLENEYLKDRETFYLSILWNRLSNQELFLLEVVSKIEVFDPIVVNDYSKLLDSIYIFDKKDSGVPTRLRRFKYELWNDTSLARWMPI